MSATKRYLEELSERHGHGGELSDEFLRRLEAGEFRDTLLIIDRATGHVDTWIETEAEFAVLMRTWEKGDEKKLRAGAVLITEGFVRMMVSSMLDS